MKNSSKKKKRKSTFLKNPLDSVAAHLGKLVDRLSGSDLMQLAGFLGLSYTYFLWEKDNPDDTPRPLELSVSASLSQAGIDMMLMNSRTEIGVGTAVAHLAGRGIIEYLESLTKKGLSGVTDPETKAKILKTYKTLDPDRPIGPPQLSLDAPEWMKPFLGLGIPVSKEPFSAAVFGARAIKGGYEDIYRDPSLIPEAQRGAPKSGYRKPLG